MIYTRAKDVQCIKLAAMTTEIKGQKRRDLEDSELHSEPLACSNALAVDVEDDWQRAKS